MLCWSNSTARLPVGARSVVGQTRSYGDVGSMSGLPESGHDWAIYEYTPLEEQGTSRTRVRPAEELTSGTKSAPFTH
jgi:hypothetical protein